MEERSFRFKIDAFSRITCAIGIILILLSNQERISKYKKERLS